MKIEIIDNTIHIILSGHDLRKLERSESLISSCTIGAIALYVDHSEGLEHRTNQPTL